MFQALCLVRTRESSLLFEGVSGRNMPRHWQLGLLFTGTLSLLLFTLIADAFSFPRFGHDVSE